MDNLPVASQSNVETSSSRTASPVRPKALVPSLHPRHNVTPGKRSDSAVTKQLKKRSPLPLRKGQQHGEGSSQGSTSGLYVNTIKPRSVSYSGVQDEAQASVSTEDFSEMESVTLSALTSSDGSSELMGSFVSEEVDGGCNTPDLMKTKAAIDHIQQKIVRTKETIKSEQTQRDNNVNEYLKCAANADKQQLQRIKSVFEKKNQKSAQTISQLQKKLENYNKRIRDLEMYGLAAHRQPKEVLRDVGQGLKDVGANIRDGITVLSGSVMSKPREFAHLIKNKFGSADNINNMTKWFIAEPSEECATDETERNHHGSATFTHRKFSGVGSTGTKYTSEDDSSSITSGSGPTAGTGTMSSPRNQPQLSLPQALGHASQTATAPTHTLPVISAHGSNNVLTSTSATQRDSYLLDQVSLKLQERQEECQRLQDEVDSLKVENQLQQEITYFHQALQEERYRYERLEEQMNDLIELHQNEIENLKQGISDMEEKVQYQSEERLRDMHEMLEIISRMEHQQQQHQQLVTLEGIENSNARALVLKLINILLTVLQVVLLLVATAANILMPFLKTRMRVITTSLLIIAIVLMCRQWPDLVDIVHTMVVGSSARL
uniref:Transmembrane and coiled-coil domains protein 1 n=1 Tax=Strigamia maritima TaxID=126957 RepID=T1J3I7_STRMM